MHEKDSLMPSLEVILQRLPETVIAALEGPVVSQDYASLQSMPAMDMTTVAMLLRRKVRIHSPMPSLEVALERLPEPLVKSLLAQQKNGRAVMLVSDIYKSTKSLSTLKSLAGPKKAKKNVMMEEPMPLLKVTLERLPKKMMTALLAKRKDLLVTKEKTKVGRPKKVAK